MNAVRRAGLLLLLALTLAGSAAAQQGSSKVGYVDMQRLIDNAPQVLAARARLEEEFGARDREFKAEQDKLAELDARVRDEGSNLPPADQDAMRHPAEDPRHSVDS